MNDFELDNLSNLIYIKERKEYKLIKSIYK